MGSAAVKLVLGLILLAAGIYLILPSPDILTKPEMLDWYEEFVTFLKGTVPPFLILLGTLIVWIESEDLKGKPTPPTVSRKPAKK